MRVPVLALLLFALLLFGCGREEGKKEAGTGVPAGKPAPPAVFAANPEGFGGIAWGTPAAELPQLTPADGAEAEGETLYVRQDEVTSLAGVPVERVEYRFRDGRFVRAVVYLGGGAPQGQAMKQALFKDYGAVGPFMAAAPVGPAGGATFKEYRWQFERGTVALSLDGGGEQQLLVFAADAAALSGASRGQ